MSYVRPQTAAADPYEPGWVPNLPYNELSAAFPAGSAMDRSWHPWRYQTVGKPKLLGLGACAGHPRVCPQSTIEDLRGLGECDPPSVWDWASRVATASTLVFLGMHLLKKKR